MYLTPDSGRRLAPILLALILAGAASTARATFWGPDYNISGGDVNETYTPPNNQRCMAVDDSNNLYVTFYDNRNQIVNGDDNYEIYFRRFTFNFGSPSITRVTDAPNLSNYPSLATLNWGAGDAATADDSARIYLTWRDARLYPIPTTGPPMSYSIFFRTYQSRWGVGFGPEIQVSPTDSFDVAASPVIAVDPFKHAWIVWQRNTNGVNPTNLFYATYDAATRTMGTSQPLTNHVAGTAYASMPAIAATRDGVVHVVWVDNRVGNKQQLWTKRYVPGAGWTADAQLVFSAGTAGSSQPSLVATYTGHLHLVWRDNRDGNYEIYYKEYFPSTGWDPTDTRITTNGFTQSDPSVDADPSNFVYLVWTDQRNGSQNPDIFFQERTGGVWQGEMPLVYSATDSTNSIQQYPGITHDGLGNTYVAWTDHRLPASSGKNKDVYYKVGTGSVTAVGGQAAPPLSRLLRNYPNPFNPATKIEFGLPKDAQVSLRVFDVHGRLVRTLVDGYLAAGRRTIEWDGRDDRGSPAASGTYFMRLSGGGAYESRTLNLLK